MLLGSLACALRLHDEETLANEARWFIKEYQFVTDTYRLYAILGLVGGDAHKSKFNSSPNMKFMLRQIKAIDYSVPGDPSQKVNQGTIPSSIYQERVAISARDEQGRLIAAEELDAALLILYGHILYAGNSFLPALNYFYRAYALDEGNPLVLLSMALCYIQQSLKRQSDNRHFQIIQGLSFMHEYRRIRERPGTTLSERQEMEFNFARVWHALGLSHLAVEGYERVLQIGEQIETERTSNAQKFASKPVHEGESGANQNEDLTATEVSTENFASEAAMALQTIFGLSGDLKAARMITEKYLII
jgi:general transcription factor 3C polypeptide 3 (transcription factor C subunit 4)